MDVFKVIQIYNCSPSRVFVGCLFLVSLVACNGGDNQTNIELIQDMMDQESVKAQDWDPKYPNKVLMKEPQRIPWREIGSPTLIT